MARLDRELGWVIDLIVILPWFLLAVAALTVIIDVLRYLLAG